MASRKGNAIIIKAGPCGSAKEALESGKVQFVHLESLGNERAEMEELEEMYGFEAPGNIAKFYPRTGDGWYYFMYGSLKNSTGKPREKNAIASKLSDRGIDLGGVVAIVTSGPMGEKFPEIITEEAFADVLKFYLDEGANAKDVFLSREKSRYKRKNGMPPGMSAAMFDKMFVAQVSYPPMQK
jgi:hypothetical protein